MSAVVDEQWSLLRQLLWRLLQEDSRQFLFFKNRKKQYDDPTISIGDDDDHSAADDRDRDDASRDIDIEEARS